MPIDWTIDHERRLVHIRLHGTVTREDVHGAVVALLGPDDVAGFDHLTVFEPGATLPLDGAALREIVRRHRHHADDRPPRVAVVPSSKLGYGLGRMAGALGEIRGTVDLRVFEDAAEARAWLDVELDADPAP